MKATLHDELMREAGFESDYFEEVARRRAKRRRRAFRSGFAMLRVVLPLLFLAGGLSISGLVHLMPRRVAGAVCAVGAFGVLFDQLLEQLAGGLRRLGVLEEPPEHTGPAPVVRGARWIRDRARALWQREALD